MVGTLAGEGKRMPKSLEVSCSPGVVGRPKWLARVELPATERPPAVDLTLARV